MSENPFVAPSATAKPPLPIGENGKPKMPGMLMTVCIIALILGLGGLGSSFFGMLGTLIQSFTMSSIPQTDPQAARFIEIQQDSMLPNLLIAGLNFLVAPLLVAGSIGVLTSKRWGLKVLRWSMILAAVYIVIKAVLTVYMQLGFANAMIDEISSAGGGPSAPPQFEGIMHSFVYIGLIFSSMFFLALFVAYISGFFYLNSKQAKRYCSTFK